MTHRILLAEIMHETNTFNRIATVKADFETRYWHEGSQAASALAGTNTEIAGFHRSGPGLCAGLWTFHWPHRPVRPDRWRERTGPG